MNLELVLVRCPLLLFFISSSALSANSQEVPLIMSEDGLRYLVYESWASDNNLTALFIFNIYLSSLSFFITTFAEAQIFFSLPLLESKSLLKSSVNSTTWSMPFLQRGRHLETLVLPKISLEAGFWARPSSISLSIPANKSNSSRRSHIPSEAFWIWSQYDFSLITLLVI